MKILIFGLGNAGLRHYQIFQGFGCDVSYIDPAIPSHGSSRSLLRDESYHWNDEMGVDFHAFDAFIVATRASQRGMIPYLSRLAKPTLIEKPLFVDNTLLFDAKAKYYSGYFRDQVWIGLQMPFMRSYEEFRREAMSFIQKHDFQEQRLSAGPCEIHVAACSNAEKWVGLRGPHTAHLPPIYEFFHDLDLGFRLFPDTLGKDGEQIHQSIFQHHNLQNASGVIGFKDLPAYRFTLCSNDDMPECRRITLRIGEKKLTWELDRAENVTAYETMDATFHNFVLNQTRPWQSMTVDRWEREMKCLGLLG